jgi:hypothetical protein
MASLANPQCKTCFLLGRTFKKKKLVVVVVVAGALDRM